MGDLGSFSVSVFRTLCTDLGFYTSREVDGSSDFNASIEATTRLLDIFEHLLLNGRRLRNHNWDEVLESDEERMAITALVVDVFYISSEVRMSMPSQ